MNESDMAITDVTMSAPTPVVSVSPVVLSAPGRAVDLQMRVSAPVTGRELPIILFSHGHGNSNNLSSLNGYGPLANFWAAHGFVVIQPTHLDSKTLGLRDAPGGPLAGLLGTTRLRRPTRTPSDWLRSSGLPGPTSAPRSTPKTPPGRQRVPR